MAKKRFLPSVLLTILALLGLASAAPPKSRGAQPPESARLLFDDEFNVEQVDTAKWFWCYPWGSADDCTNNQTGIPYREEEQYRPENVVEGRGFLQLVALRHSVKPDFPWISGFISTGGPFESGTPHPTFAFQYGYAEVRAKVPSGNGFWPAFWMVPANGDWPPEIDIMEGQGGQPNLDDMTVWFVGSHSEPDSIQCVYIGPDFSQGYHVYAVDWQPDVLIWYVDDVERCRITAAQIEESGGKLPDTPMYVIANLALGGWVSPPDKQTPPLASMSIDYIRVWDRKP